MAIYAQHIFESRKFESVVNDAVNFFAKTPISELPPKEQFQGIGVYALYYSGAFKPYANLAKLNRNGCIHPIYVGKAVPLGWRTARSKESKSNKLHQRLREHARSIQQVKNLTVEDFRCRFMMLNGPESDLVVPVEAEMIRRYRPLWNTVVDGFGNHDPGAGRYNQARSEWDMLHPGRTWANRLTGKSPKLDDILMGVKAALGAEAT